MRKIYILFGISIISFLLCINKAFCMDNIKYEVDGGIDGITIKIAGSDQVFKGTLYQYLVRTGRTVENNSSSKFKTVRETFRINRVLVDKQTAIGILNALGKNENAANCSGNLCTYVIGCDLNQDLQGTMVTFRKGSRSNIETRINFEMFKATSSTYMENKEFRGGRWKISSTSPTYKENNVNMDGDYKDTDLFYINDNYSIRAIANATGAEVKWENNIVTLSNHPEDIFVYMKSYCSNV